MEGGMMTLIFSSASAPHASRKCAGHELVADFYAASEEGVREIKKLAKPYTREQLAYPRREALDDRARRFGRIAVTAVITAAD
jgi:hypothetical protein